MNAYELAAKRLAGGARTEKELIDFLCRKGIDREEATKVAVEFRQDGYIDDCRYSRDYITYGEGKGWGRSRIIRELSKKGIPKELADKAYAEREDMGEAGSDSEVEKALRVVEKMMRGNGTDSLDEKTRGRIARRLFTYGYTTSVIYEVISIYEKGREEE